MVSIGYFLSCEEFGPRDLVRQARWAEEVGFERLWISDHFHPWNDEQGQSPFVWPVIGALSEATRPVGPDSKRYIESLREYADAGYDEVYLQQIGTRQKDFFRFWAADVAPQITGGTR